MRIEINTECVSPAAAGVVGRKVVGDRSVPPPKTTSGEALEEGADARRTNRVLMCTADG